MLASITPLGERGRGSTWGVTITAFVLGATVAGAALGAALGALGGAVLTAVGDRGRLAALALALAVALALDLRRRGVPGPRRQVNERWLDEFRGWVYGLGFGTQLGVGVTTIVASAATYVALLAAFLSCGALRGALIVGCYGAIRGVTPLAAAHVKRPDQLVALHARLDRWRAPGQRILLLALAATLSASLIGAVA